MARIITRVLRRLGIVVFRPRETLADRRRATTAALAESAPPEIVARLRKAGCL
jgi:hypothetical protein